MKPAISKKPPSASALIKAGQQRFAAVKQERAAAQFSADEFVRDYAEMDSPRRARALGRRNRRIRYALDDLAAATTKTLEGSLALQKLPGGQRAVDLMKDPETVRWLANVIKAKNDGKPLLARYHARRLPPAAREDADYGEILRQFAGVTG